MSSVIHSAQNKLFTKMNLHEIQLHAADPAVSQYKPSAILRTTI